jgi:hypothetical protein
VPPAWFAAVGEPCVLLFPVCCLFSFLLDFAFCCRDFQGRLQSYELALELMNLNEKRVQQLALNIVQ